MYQSCCARASTAAAQEQMEEVMQTPGLWAGSVPPWTEKGKTAQGHRLAKMLGIRHLHSDTLPSDVKRKMNRKPPS